MPGKILIIDDEEKLRSLLARLIKLEGYIVFEAANLRAATKAIEVHEPDVILCDVKLPDGNGVDFIATFKPKHPGIEIILLTAYGNIPDGIQAMKNGAFDYIAKGDDNNKIIPLLSKAFEKVGFQKRIASLENQVGKKYNFENIIGHSKPIKFAIELAKKVAETDTTVLLLGETGTGKEVFAQAIHQASKRSSKPFVAINCSAFSRELLESELFDHKAGAFTGAIKDKKGLFEEANSGTLFLDELGEMAIELQAKLLRVLETGEFIKIGDSQPIKVNVRIIAATNRNLDEEIEKGNFRSDLFYRLSVFQITLPSLRKRISDIELLAQNFTNIFSFKTNKKVKFLSEDFIKSLEQNQWKGNIRELKNVIERAVIMCDGDTLNTDNLPYEMQHSISNSGNQSPSFSLSVIEKLHIQKILNYTKGNKTETAKLLNIGLTTLYRKIEEYKL